MQVVITPDAALRRLEYLYLALGKGKARVALARAVNHTGRKALTAVRRAMVAQTSIPRPVIVAGVTPRSASSSGSAAIAFVIVGSGRKIPLKLFRPRRTKSGVTARVWGGPKAYPSAFIVRSLGSHVFRRVGKSRLPIEKLSGPDIASEMIKDQSLAAFERVVGELPTRLTHEVDRLLS